MTVFNVRQLSRNFYFRYRFDIGGIGFSFFFFFLISSRIILVNSLVFDAEIDEI